MTARTPSQASLSFTGEEWRTLRGLRRRYQQDHDLFSATERAHLRFLRWLYQSGRLEP